MSFKKKLEKTLPKEWNPTRPTISVQFWLSVSKMELSRTIDFHLERLLIEHGVDRPLFQFWSLKFIAVSSHDSPSTQLGSRQVEQNFSSNLQL